MAACPSNQDFERYSAGQLDQNERAQVESHASTCPSCAHRIDVTVVAPSHESTPDAVTIVADPAMRRPASTTPGSSAFDHATSSQLNRLGAHVLHTSQVRADSQPYQMTNGDGAPPGVMVEGYRIIREVARGGMGIVYEAIQLKLNRRVALKVLPAVGSGADDQVVKRFVHEATAAAKLHHTHIVPIYDFGQSGHTYFYAMELIEGWPLTEMIKRFSAGNAPAADNTTLAELVRGRNVPLPGRGSRDDTAISSSNFSSAGKSRGRTYYRHVAQWIANAADGLFYAHSQGIIHRDIKPGNLMLCTDGRIMILDFGLAKTTGDMSMTTTGALVGTLRYMSPEQAMGKRLKIDHRTDIYSLGATLYELLAFQPAFRGADEKETLGMIITRDATPPRKIIPEVPRELEIICLKTLEKDPGSRYATGKDLADDLRRYVQDIPIMAKPTGPIGRAIKFARRRRAVTIAGCAILLLAVSSVLAAYAIRRAHESDRQKRLREIELHNAIVDRLTNEGAELLKRKDWDKAEKKYEELLAFEPKGYKALSNLVGIKFQRYGDKAPNDVVDALLDRARELDQNRVETWNLMGILRRMRGRLDEAIEAHQHASQIDPNFYANWISWASTCAIKSDLVEAERCLLRGTSLCKPTDGTQPWHNLAAVQHQLGKPEAVQSIDRAFEINSADVASTLLKARILLAGTDKGLLKRGRNAAITADELSKHASGRAARMVALAELRSENWDDAIDYAQKARDLSDAPYWPPLITALAEAHKNHLDKAKGQLYAVEAMWPQEFKGDRQYIVADQRMLWFESRRELEALRVEAEMLISAGTPK